MKKTFSVLERISAFAVALGCVAGVGIMLLFIKGLGFDLWPAAGLAAAVGIGAGVLSFFLPAEEISDSPVDS